MRVLLLDDDRELVDLLAFALRRAGLTPLPAYTAAQALGLLEDERPDLVVLDVNLGTASGLDVLRDVRRRSQVPVIMLSGLDGEEDKVRGLEMGADDYVSKPFSHRELISRIRAQVRRTGQIGAVEPRASEPVHIPPLELNPAEFSALKDDVPLRLTLTEFRLLHYLMMNAGSVVPTPTLLRHVWGYSDATAADVVRVAVHRLRRKVEDDPRHPTLLHTVPGVGVMFKPRAPTAPPETASPAEAT